VLTADTKLISVDDHVIEPPGELNARRLYNFW
jgi:hypothetical protein